MQKYQTPSEAPPARQSIKGVPLQVYQINAIDKAAIASADPFQVAIGKVTAEFVEQHKIENGQWVPKAGGN